MLSEPNTPTGQTSLVLIIVPVWPFGFTVTLPKPQTSNNKFKGLFVKADFRFFPDHHLYVCSVGEALLFASHKRETGGLNQRLYPKPNVPYVLQQPIPNSDILSCNN